MNNHLNLLCFFTFIIIYNLFLVHKMQYSLFSRRLSSFSVVASPLTIKKLFRFVSVSGLVLSSFPIRASCSPIDKDSDDGKSSNRSEKQQKEKFDFEKFLASELGEKGSLNGVKKLIESGIPGQVGYGFVMGYSSGFCLKKVSRIAAFLLGSSFVLIQTLSYSGLIKVDYEGIQDKMEQVLDLNKDGKVDIEDFKFAQDKVMDVLGYNMPAGGGFAAGLLAGFRA